MQEKTQVFEVQPGMSKNKAIVREVYNALVEKGYDPISQLSGYILSEDPTYITSHKGARCLITKIDRYDLLAELLKDYLA